MECLDIMMPLIDVPNCPIDGADGPVKYVDVCDAFFGTQGRWTYRQHPKTGHLWLARRPADQFIGALYTNYYTHEVTAQDPVPGIWQQAIAFLLSVKLGYPLPQNTSTAAKLLSMLPSLSDAAELEVMRIHAGEKGRLLDVGCGSGNFLKRMYTAGWEVVGTEPDKQATVSLASKDGFQIYNSLEELIQGEKQGFDIIVLSHVIEHVIDPINTLVELRRLLRGGGRLLLTTPNALSLGSRIFSSFWRGLEPPRHFNIFSPESLSHALKRAGLMSVKINTEVRLARGIWYLSYLSYSGKRELEITDRVGHFPLKLVGYLFQLLEAVTKMQWKFIGEEIFCIAKVP